jgi:nucleoside 2-deoxyribosyltransferase
MEIPSSCPLCDAIEVSDTRARQMFERRAINGFEWFLFECDRCGTYRVEQDWLADETRDGSRTIPLQTALHLSYLARRTKGSKALTITSANCQELVRGAPPTPTGAEFFDRVIDFLASASPFPGVATRPAPLRSYAAHVHMPTAAFVGTANLLSDEKTLRWKDDSLAKASLELLPEGWRRAEVARRKGPLGNRAFVAMWFSDAVKEAYTQGIKSALIDAGYAPPFRVDDPEHDRAHAEPDYRPRVDDRILAELRRARFVIVDVTGARDSVFFEAGYAEALGLPMIWCCHESEKNNMAFDTRQHAHILWKDPADLKQRLADRLESMGLVRR